MGTGVMTRADVDRLMASTDPGLVHLLLDTGHLAFAGDDPVAAAYAYADRIGHVHLKDIRPEVVSRVREEGLSFQEGILDGVFTVPGDGAIDFVPVLEALGAAAYRGLAGRRGRAGPGEGQPARVRAQGQGLPARSPRVVSPL